MKIKILVILLCSSLLLNAQEKKTAPLADIVRQISNSLRDATIDQSKIKITGVNASFTISKASSAGGEFKIWIFKVGRKRERTDTRKISLSLTAKPVDVSESISSKSSSELTLFIKSALNEFMRIDPNLLPSLNERIITLEIGLTITKSGNVGGGYEIGIFSLSAEGGRSSEQGHTLELTFARVN